ncbi:hypothetical protein [Galbitalea soli]|uniref:EcsC family protein n=1 Tax=Galbitalea soli TaxID=1268042 RepID=A0A7C9TQ74_9MICO|nr:hypothetical protein [Galbitalea soli]NEM90560.1 hypothetical protein [Galbitalea soli]NYJ31275.1 hypothetical protein [Galbitalea soli]
MTPPLRQLPSVPTNPVAIRGVEKLLSVQRPVVLAHLRTIRKAHPNASPAEVIRILERRYVAAVTTGGAAVGATAVIPGVGVVASLALSSVETAGFLEASALFAQSVTEVHGIAIDDPERARTLVMAMILGSAGSELVEQLAGQVTGTAPARSAFWGELVTKKLPRSALSRIGQQVRKSFIKRFAARTGGHWVGRALPFGIGAVIGGSGNFVLGRSVVASSRTAFGPPPFAFPLVLDARFAETDSPSEPTPPPHLSVPGGHPQ